MAWTSPATWTAGQVVGAADLNSQLRDNMSYLLNGRPKQVIKRDNAGDYTTTSSSFVAIDSTNLAITLTLSGTIALLMFSGMFNGGFNSSYGPHTALDFDIDGTRYLSAGNEGFGSYNSAVNNNSGKVINTIMALVTGLSVGSHTFKVFWKTTDTQTSTLYAGSGVSEVDSIPTFSAVEIG